MNRRSIIKSLLAAPLALFVKPKALASGGIIEDDQLALFHQHAMTRDEIRERLMQQPKCGPTSKAMFNVASLEHEGWGFRAAWPTDPQRLFYVPYAESGSSRYITRWQFETRQEAIDYVRSLIPMITKVWVQEDPKEIVQLKSGYRDAVRAQVRGAEPSRIECWIGQRGVKYSLSNTDGVVPVEIKGRPPFWSIDDAWGWLMSLQVNHGGFAGEHVSRPPYGKATGLSEYLTRPFRYDRDKVVVIKNGQEPEHQPYDRVWYRDFGKLA